MSFKIQYLGFLPAIIVVGVTFWAFIAHDMQIKGYKNYKGNAAAMTIALFITILGLIWGLSGI